MADILGFPIDAVDEEVSDNKTTCCTLYYLDENNVPTIHDIDIPSNNTNENYVKDVIKKVKQDIKGRRKDKASVLSTSYTTKYIGKYTRSYANTDVALLEVTYKCYTLQNYHGEDFYTIIGTIYANPGRALYDAGKTSYDRDIEGDGLDVSIAASSSTSTRVEYGPTRTINSSSYSFDLGGDWSSDGVSVSSGFSYSQNIEDTDIDVNSLPTVTEWNVTLTGDAQKQTCTFCPAITYSTSSSSSYAKFYVDTTFNTDAWNELPTYTHIDKSICCYPSKIEL